MVQKETGGAASTGITPHTGLVAAIYFGLALFYFLPALLPGNHIFGTDYLAGGYFFYDFISERFADGALPKWVPYVYGGLPLFANPGSAFYPIRFLVDVLLPSSRVMPALYVAQFGLAGLGGYLLAREIGVRRWVAFIAGLAFQFTGLTMSYVFAGHDGRIIVATLAPLFLFFLHRGVRTGGPGAFLGAAAALGFALLSFQIQSAYYLLLAGALWAVFCLVHLRIHRTPGRLVRRTALGLAAVAFGFAMATVNFLPFLDYIDASPRGGEEGRGYDYSVSWSMPPEEISGLALPEAVGVSVMGTYEGRNPFKLHTEYVGVVVLLLLALGPFYARRSRYWWFFLGLALFALTLSFGGHTPLYRLYYEVLPGTKRFRAPSISFFLVSLSLVMMAAMALERLAGAVAERARARSGEEDGGAHSLRPAAWVSGGFGVLGLLAIIWAAGGADTSAQGQALVGGAARFALFGLATAGLVWAWTDRKLATRTFSLLLAVVVVADLWVIDRHFFETTDPPEAMFRSDDVMDFLRTREDRDRVWILPVPAGRVYRSGMPDYPMAFEIDQVAGEHPNPLQRYLELLGAGEQSYVDWHNFLGGTPVYMNVANVRYIVSMVRLDGVPEFPDLRLVHGGPSALIYENPHALPRAYLVGDVVVAEGPDALDILGQPDFDPRATAVVAEPLLEPLPDSVLDGDAEVVEYGPDRVVVRTRATQRALLVLADNHYDGWRATVDGEDRAILRTNHTFRGVVVGPGRQEVIFEFRPPALYTGLWIYLGCLAILAGYLAFTLLWRRLRGPAPAGAGGVGA